MRGKVEGCSKLEKGHGTAKGGIVNRSWDTRKKAEEAKEPGPREQALYRKPTMNPTLFHILQAVLQGRCLSPARLSYAAVTNSLPNLRGLT